MFFSQPLSMDRSKAGYFLMVALCMNIVDGFVNTGDLEYNVELNVFSGRPNPKWTVSRSDPMYSVVSDMVNSAPSTRLGTKIGYSGFSIQARNALGERAHKTIGAGSSPDVEMSLLRSCPHSLGRSVKSHIQQEIYENDDVLPKPEEDILEELPSPPRPEEDILEELPSPPRQKYCRYSRFDPVNWNYEPVIINNNCYNYATKRQTNTFAQPGRASGSMYELPITAKSVLPACLSDGLIELPIYAPHLYRHMCYIALAIWPYEDFHFYRLDSDMLWSHKPGQTPARKTDNSGNLIYDPRKADRGMYEEFVGFLGNHPHVVVD